MKKHLLLFFSLFCFQLSASLAPPVVDFNRTPPSFDATAYMRKLEGPAAAAFNWAPEIGAFLEHLLASHPVEAIVETGTFKGSTTAYLALLANQVHTIEVIEETYNFSKERLKDFSNITFHLGSSEVVMKDLLPKLEGKSTLFYLDAHWYENWPLLQELEEISKTHHDNCIVVIDDFKVPGRKDIGYDKYSKHECSIDYIYPKLKKIFSDYTIHFVIPKNLGSRAKFVAYPKKWAHSTIHL